MIGLMGAHRTGKTTLAKAYSEKHNVPLCLTSASGTFKQLGYDPQQDYPLDIRLTIQEAILKAFDKQYGDMKERVFIADRTPVDMLAYTLADISREKLSDELEIRLARYINDCFALCNKHFSILIAVQPGIPLVYDPTKAPIGNGYIEHVARLVMGIALDERLTARHAYIPKHITDLETRIMCVENTRVRCMDIMMDDFDRYADANGKVKLH